MASYNKSCFSINCTINCKTNINNIVLQKNKEVGGVTGFGL